MIEKLIVDELPPPGVGLATKRFATCPADKDEAGTMACRLVSLEAVVTRDVPLRVATLDAMYPEPVKVSVMVGEPAVTLDGDTALTVGAGFDAGAVGGGGLVGAVVPEPDPDPPPLQPVSVNKPNAEITAKIPILPTTSPKAKRHFSKNQQIRAPGIGLSQTSYL